MKELPKIIVVSALCLLMLFCGGLAAWNLAHGKPNTDLWWAAFWSGAAAILVS